MEKRTTEQKLDTKEAVRDALTSAKELVAQQSVSNKESIDKSEKVFTKQIDATDLRVDDLKTRLERIEAGKEGGQEVTTTRQASLAGLVGVAGLIAAVVLGVSSIAVALIVKG